MGGNAGVLTEGDRMLCAYRFGADVTYSMNVMERPAPGSDDPVENRFDGDVKIVELVSGLSAEAATLRMRTSLREPKPKKHVAVLRPVLNRLELSLAYFVRRFERRFLTYPGSQQSP